MIEIVHGSESYFPLPKPVDDISAIPAPANPTGTARQGYLTGNFASGHSSLQEVIDYVDWLEAGGSPPEGFVEASMYDPQPYVRVRESVGSKAVSRAIEADPITIHPQTEAISEREAGLEEATEQVALFNVAQIRSAMDCGGDRRTPLYLMDISEEDGAEPTATYGGHIYSLQGHMDDYNEVMLDEVIQAFGGDMIGNAHTYNHEYRMEHSSEGAVRASHHYTIFPLEKAGWTISIADSTFYFRSTKDGAVTDVREYTEAWLCPPKLPVESLYNELSKPGARGAVANILEEEIEVARANGDNERAKQLRIELLEELVTIATVDGNVVKAKELRIELLEEHIAIAVADGDIDKVEELRDKIEELRNELDELQAQAANS